MPTSVPLTLQVVNGDPATTGGNINITTNTISAAFAIEDGTVSLSTVESNDRIEIDGLEYSYEYLGSHLVRSDPNQPAAYIRITGPLPAGSTLSIGDTFAFDLTGEPGDPDYPNLQQGNTKGSVADLDTTTPIQFPGFICFAAGTRIRTPNGDVLVENLRAGDLVDTLDHGPKPVRMVASRTLDFSHDDPRHLPIEFKPGSLGPDLPEGVLCVSPQHRMLIDVAQAPYLVPAKGLLELPGVRQKLGCKRVVYVHVVFDDHQIIYANGSPTESFFPGAEAIKSLDETVRAEVFEIFPQLQDIWADPERYFARPVIAPSKMKRILREAQVS